MGGVDVTWRAFHLELPIKPAIIEYPLRLPAGLPQVVFINTVSLLPGTLIADSYGDTLQIHVLDDTGGFIDEIRSVEQSIAKIFVVALDKRYSGVGV
jgi:multicomponent Na+:H+ antiporter subunit E